MPLEHVGAPLDLRLKGAGGEVRGEPQHIDGQIPHLEVRRKRPPPKDLAQEQEKPAAGVVQVAVRLQIEAQLAGGGTAILEEQGIPHDSPGPG